MDVVAAGKPLVSTDFNGETACKAPRKIVVYQLPADTDLTLQFSAADADRTLFAVTQVPAARTMSRWLLFALLLASAACGGAGPEHAAAAGAASRSPIVAIHLPFEFLDAGAREQFELGLAAFNTGWVPAGQKNAGRRDGVGPLTVWSELRRLPQQWRTWPW